MREHLTRALAIAATGAAAVAAPSASANWEPSRPVDLGGEAAGATTAVDAAVGANGLLSLLLLQRHEVSEPAGPRTVHDPFMVRRAAGGAPSSPALVTNDSHQASQSDIARLAANGGGDALGLFYSASARILGAAWFAGAPAPSAATTALCGTLAPPRSTCFSPDVGVDDAGRGYAVAVASSSSFEAGDVLLSRFDPAAPAWTTTTKLADGMASRVAVNRAGDLVVTYLSPVPGQVSGSTELRLFAIRQRAGDSAPSAPATLSQPGDSVAAYDVGIDEGGNVIAAFAQDPQRPLEGFDRVFVRRWLASRPHPESSVESASPSPQESPLEPGVANPRLAIDPGGNVTVAWSQSTISTRLLSAERRADTGRWLRAEVGSTPTPFGYDLAVDAAGTANLLLATNNDVTAHRRAAGRVWAPGHRLTVAGGGSIVEPLVRVVAARGEQADAAFIQRDGPDGDPNFRDRLFASRFEGPPPVTAAAQLAPASSAGRRRCRDRWAPRSAIDRGRRLRTSRRGVSARGTSRDRSNCVVSRRARGRVAGVVISLARVVRGGCSYLHPSGRFGRRRTCRHPLLALRGSVRHDGARQRTRWSFRRRLRLAPGRYVLDVRGVDAAGNLERTRHRAHSARFRVR